MSGIFSSSKTGSSKDTILPTVFKVSKDELEYWTNMTCFYDKQWEFNPKLSTVPISFMHITSITEVTQAQGSEKRVIVYESPASAGDGFDPKKSSHPASKSNLEVIMDNVVVQPRQYQMDVIIPDSLVGPYHKQGLSRLSALLLHMEETGTNNTFTRTVATSIRWAQATIGVFDTAASVMDMILGSWGNSSQIARMNKNSLDAMAQSGRVVLFKKWTGYDYSYGIITRLEVSRRPSEEGVYRGTIAFQETPILNISPKKVAKKKASSGYLGGVGGALSAFGDSVGYGSTKIARIMSLTLAFPFIKLTGVMDEAGTVGSDSAAPGGWNIDIFG